MQVAQEANELIATLLWAEGLQEAAAAQGKALEQARLSEVRVVALRERAEAAEAGAQEAREDAATAFTGEQMARAAVAKALELLDESEAKALEEKDEMKELLMEAIEEGERVAGEAMDRAEARLEEEVLHGLDMACQGLGVAEGLQARLD